MTLRALALYRETLQAKLEPKQAGRGLAIHPDSGDYLVTGTPTHASHVMRVRHPEGGTITPVSICCRTIPCRRGWGRNLSGGQILMLLGHVRN